MVLAHYKALYRRINRLPLDHQSLKVAKEYLRSSFVKSKKAPTHSVVNRKLYDRAVSVFDSLLVDEKYKDYHRLLDLIYRDLKPRNAWVEEFDHMRYGSFKDTWPQVHVIRAFGDSKACKVYDDELAKMLPVSDFSFSNALGISSKVNLDMLTPLETPSNSLSNENKRSRIVEKITVFHKFLKTNAKALSETQIHPLDVCYKPNRYGLPPSISIMEAELKGKVNYAKKLLDIFKPIELSDLQHLISVAVSRDGTPKINPSFYRFMLRKRAKEGLVSRDMRKYVRHKQLIPNERNLLFHYRSYVVRQFYIDRQGKYAMSPMRNIYD